MYILYEMSKAATDLYQICFGKNRSEKAEYLQPIYILKVGWSSPIWTMQHFYGAASIYFMVWQPCLVCGVLNPLKSVPASFFL